MILFCLLLVVFACVLSALFCGMMLRLGVRLDMLDRAGGEAHKRHARDVPNTGGIAIAMTVIGSLLGLLAASWVLPNDERLVDPELHAGLRSMTTAGAALIGAMALLHGVGLMDDRKAMPPWPKLIAQIGAALLVVTAGQTRVLYVLDDLITGGYAISILISVLWLVVITNAMNMLDNMDGLSGGVGAIAAAVYLVAALIGGQWFVAGAAALLLGALIGFLLFNFPPAKLFMGDSGSLVVGLLLGVLSIRTTYLQTEAGQVVAGHWHGVLTPLLVMAVPLYDFCSVVTIRLRQGRKPWVGDHQHFSHRLVMLGLTRRRAVGVIWLATAATGLGGIVLGRVAPWQAAVVAAGSLTVLAMIALLEHGAAKGRRGVRNDE